MALCLAAACTATLSWHSVIRPEATAESPATGRAHGSVRKARPRIDPSELLERVRTAQASGDSTAVFSHLAALIRADPPAAARFAETNGDAATRGMILHRVAQLWAGRDSHAALAWAADLSNPAERNAIITDVCLQIAERDPAEAVRMIGEYPDVGLEALGQRWAERDFAAARAWALSRPEGTQRDNLVARLAFLQARDSPREAATLAANEIPAGEIQTEAVLAVLHQWIKSDPAATEDWVARFPESGLKTRAVNELQGVARSRPAAGR